MVSLNIVAPLRPFERVCLGWRSGGLAGCLFAGSRAPGPLSGVPGRLWGCFGGRLAALLVLGGVSLESLWITGCLWGALGCPLGRAGGPWGRLWRRWVDLSDPRVSFGPAGVTLGRPLDPRVSLSALLWARGCHSRPSFGPAGVTVDPSLDPRARGEMDEMSQP